MALVLIQFVIYIIEIVDEVDSYMSLFADNCKLQKSKNQGRLKDCRKIWAGYGDGVVNRERNLMSVSVVF